MTTKEEKATLVSEALEHLSGLIAKPASDFRNASREERAAQQKIYVVIRSVAKSGLSRTMDFYVIDADGDLRWITGSIATLCGYSRAKDDSLRVSGCGMDMRFAVLDSLAHKMWPGEGLSGNAFRICDI